MNPFFKTVPEAYKKWNAYYIHSYVALGSIVAAAAAGVLALTNTSGIDQKVLGVAAIGLVGSTVIFSQIGKRKRRKAIDKYNDVND